MSVYLVDYENVNADGFRGVERLNKDDSVYVFYTTNAENLSFELHKKQIADMVSVLQNGGDPLVDIYEGKRAVDVVLSAYESNKKGKKVFI